MSTDKRGHFGSADLDDLHDSIPDTTEDGACLTGHSSRYENFTNENTCNYRYQACEQAKSNQAIKKRLHGYSTRRRKTLKVSAEGGAYGNYPANYVTELDPPRKGDWHVGGPDRPITRGSIKGGPVTIPRGENFTRGTWPYWNNAHHLISKGTFSSQIEEKGKEDSRVSELIQQCLLVAKYNINHKENMLLIPQDREVATMLGMPAHLQFEESADGKVKKSTADHPVWSEYITVMENGLNKILKSYASTCKGAITKADKQGHDEPKTSLSKEKLVKLSGRLRRIVLRWKKGTLDENARIALEKDFL